MTLDLVQVRGRSIWWTWTIQDDTGAVVEQSMTQYLSEAAARSNGLSRMAELEKRRPSKTAPPGVTGVNDRWESP